MRALTPVFRTGKRVWWHSSAHIVGECAERHYGCNLAIGPPTDEGFYYEMGMTDERCVVPRPCDPAELMKDAQGCRPVGLPFARDARKERRQGEAKV